MNWRNSTLGQKEMRAPDYTAINPNGRVPTLIDGDTYDHREHRDRAVSGGQICARLGTGPGAQNFAEYLQWLHYAEGMIMPPINNYVVETILLPPDRRNDEIAMRALKLLNRTLAAVGGSHGGAGVSRRGVHDCGHDHRARGRHGATPWCGVFATCRTCQPMPTG